MDGLLGALVSLEVLMRAVKELRGGELVGELVLAAESGDKEAVRAWVVGFLSNAAQVEAVARFCAEGGSSMWAAALISTRGVRGGAKAADEAQRAVERRMADLERAKGDPKREARLRVQLEAAQVFRTLAESAGIQWNPQLPEGWECCERGVWPVDEDGMRRGDKAARCPVLIVGMQQADQEQLVEVAWTWDQGATWERTALKRSVMRSVQAMLAGADSGFPVDSGTAAGLVRWLGDLEAVNKRLLPCRRVASRFGWCREGFVLGSGAVRYPGAEPVELAGGPTLKGLAKAMEPKGTWEGWKATFSQAVDGRPLVAVPVIGAVASVLLHLLQEPGFVLSLDGPSGGGKTTAAKLAVSVWAGLWDGFAISWNTSAAGVEDRAALLQHLPLMLDETQQARSPEAVQELLYQLPNGVGRVKGSLDGEGRVVREWRLVVLSTGENKILDFTKAAGAAARTISVPGLPFGKADKDSEQWKANEQAVINCDHGTQAHGGHLGPRVLQLLVGLDIPRLREEHKTLRDFYAGQAQGSARRLARYLAVLNIAQRVAEAAGMPKVGEEPLRLVWEAAQNSGAAVDVPGAAWEDLQAWLWKEDARFQRSADQRVPQQGWLGWYTSDELCILPAALKEQLVAWGYGREVGVVLQGWVDKGYMDRRGDKLTVLRRTKDGGRPPVYALKRVKLGVE